MKQTKYEIMKQLMVALDTFETEEGIEGIVLEDFIGWVQKKNNKIGNEKNEEDGRNNDFLNIEISSHIGYLYRYAKHYSKKALQNSKLTTLDDYVFLMSLLIEGEQSKTNLIQNQILEISSGTEVIKRLLKDGLIEEVSNKADKRSKKIKISLKGINTIQALGDTMNKTAQLVGGNLNTDEKIKLVEMVKKLKGFHDHIHQADKKTDLEKIFIRYLDTGL